MSDYDVVPGTEEDLIGRERKGSVTINGLVHQLESALARESVEADMRIAYQVKYEDLVDGIESYILHMDVKNDGRIKMREVATSLKKLLIEAEDSVRD